jgi:ferredoxin--NADP+ reductase
MAFPASTETKYVRGIVTARREITSDLWIVRVAPAEKILFAPGQYATMGLQVGPKMIERPYSLASSPHEPELEFFLELVPGGKLTPHLHEVPVGGEVFLRRSAKGSFFYDERSGHINHFMVATVTGVAPYMSMMRRFLAVAGEGKPVAGQVTVIFAASVSEELAYHDELSRYAAEHAWFHYIPTVSRIWLDPAWNGERGRAEDIARKYLDQFGFTAADTTAYVCGNPTMGSNVRGVLQRNGFAKEAIKEEQYWPATA